MKGRIGVAMDPTKFVGKLTPMHNTMCYHIKSCYTDVEFILCKIPTL